MVNLIFIKKFIILSKCWFFDLSNLMNQLLFFREIYIKDRQIKVWIHLDHKHIVRVVYNRFRLLFLLPSRKLIINRLIHTWKWLFSAFILNLSLINLLLIFSLKLSIKLKYFLTFCYNFFSFVLFELKIRLFKTLVNTLLVLNTSL